MSNPCQMFRHWNEQSGWDLAWKFFDIPSVSLDLQYVYRATSNFCSAIQIFPWSTSNHQRQWLQEEY